MRGSAGHEATRARSASIVTDDSWSLTGAGPWTRLYSGTVFRAASPEWARRQNLLDGRGAFRVGGRWSPPGIHAAYVSERAEAALSEYLARARAQWLPDHSELPAVVASGEVHLQRILDLSGPKPFLGPGIQIERPFASRWAEENEAGRESESQAWGRVASEVGFEAIRVPSAAVAGAMNLVILVELLLPESKVESRGLAD